jgi:UDP-N-acetylmuramoyl-L-alanyl-D-glutamate--2,6-diaminopimelate ligase
MQLKELVKQLSVLRIDGSLDREIVGIAYDSRAVSRRGCCSSRFQAHASDGHEFISSAIDRGAAAIICERNGFSSPRATKIQVPDVREALARAAASYYQQPSTRLLVIGVTGTNGKTTVAFMVKEVLEAAGLKTGLLGTVRYEIGDRVIPAQRTTPESLDISR